MGSPSPRSPLRRSIPQPGAVYPIADVGKLGASSVPETVAALAAAGARWIQIRSKGEISDAELWELLERCRSLVEGSGAELWIDDRADLAALLGLHLHLGQSDLPAAAARKVVGEEVWIGLSSHGEAEVAAAQQDRQVDVVAFGPVFSTRSKERPDPVVGLQELERARRATAKPLVAIGGIDARRIAGVLATGADSAAVIGALDDQGPRPEEVAGSFRRLCRAAENQTYGEGMA